MQVHYVDQDLPILDGVGPGVEESGGRDRSVGEGCVAGRKTMKREEKIRWGVRRDRDPQTTGN